VTPDLPVYVLDSYALLAYLSAEPGAARLQELLALASAGRCRLCLCLINLGEVLYITERHRGLDKAQSVLALLESLPLELLEANRDLVLEAAHIKAAYQLSYADAFVVAAARRLQAVILTGDPEFAAMEQIVKVEWLVTG
jgi:ribonuclease VapC